MLDLVLLVAGFFAWFYLQAHGWGWITAAVVVIVAGWLIRMLTVGALVVMGQRRP